MTSRLRTAGALVVAGLSLVLAGCESLSYYSQAIGGQVYLLTHREKITELVEDEATPESLSQKLQTVLEIRQFAEQELSLPLGKTFSTYVDIERPYVVWNVFVTPEFSMNPVNWCYPVAGCVSYRGYFDEQRARQYARKQREKGLDVYVGGVSAYSTLGWFADPVLNTVIGRADHQLAALVFHELAHQQVYLKGDTEFNESFATAVEREGLRRWLQANYSDERSREISREAQLEFSRREEFVALVQQTVIELEALYSQVLDDEQMRSRKQAVLDTLQSRYQVLRESWGGYSGYDRWFSQPLNNAQLNTVATYFRWVGAFEALLIEQNNNLELFYDRVADLAQQEKEQRQRALKALMQDGR